MRAAGTGAPPCQLRSARESDRRTSLRDGLPQRPQSHGGLLKAEGKIGNTLETFAQLQDNATQVELQKSLV